MAPEQVLGLRGGVTTAVDVYGLGAVLYKLLTGHPPFRAASVYEILRQVREREPEPPSARGRRVERDLEAICLRCLGNNLRRRYPSARAWPRTSIAGDRASRSRRVIGGTVPGGGAARIASSPAC